MNDASLVGKKYISIVVPIYNEERNIPVFHQRVSEVLGALPYDYEIIFVNDGSVDSSHRKVRQIARAHSRVKYIELSRNFGKEIATTAGIHASRGDAAIIIDADLQHPVELIPEFIGRWEQGAEIVVGVRRKTRSDTVVKRVGSRLFYRIMNLISETTFTPNSTDYRLIDRKVIEEFNKFTEKERMTRGLIDWLGFKRDTVHFEANERLHGEASYSLRKLIGLAFSSLISHSLFPLRIASYLGVFITVLAAILGAVMLVDYYFDAWRFSFSGPAMLATLILFLVGIVLISLGLLAFYIAHIFKEAQNRPLYVVRRKANFHEK